MEAMVKVSFIIPAYNAADTIERTIDSVLAQRMRDFELLLIDDGSTDDTLLILEERAARDARIKVLRNTCNKGVSAARNLGLDHSAGEFVRFIDADDTIPAGSTGDMVRIANRRHADMVMGVMRRHSAVHSYNYGRTIRAAEQKTFDRYDENLIHSFSICNKMFRRSVIEKHHIRFASYKHAEDGLFLYDFLQYTNHLAGYKKIAYVYNKPEFFEKPSATKQLTKEMLEGILEIADKIIGMHPDAPQRFIDDFRARILGTTLINEYYRQLWRMDQETFELLMEKISAYWEMLPEKQRRSVKALNKDLPAPDHLAIRKEICDNPVFTIVVDKAVSGEHLEILLASLYYQKMPYFKVVVDPERARDLSSVFRGQENLEIAPVQAFLASADQKCPGGTYMQVIGDNITYAYETLARAYVALQKRGTGIRGQVLVRKGRQLIPAENRQVKEMVSPVITCLNQTGAASQIATEKTVWFILSPEKGMEAPAEKAAEAEDNLFTAQLLVYASILKNRIRKCRRHE